MFSQEQLILFISKQQIDPAWVTIGREISIRHEDTISYTKETLSEAFQKIGAFSKGNIRVVLSDELVYVAGFSVSSETKVTRELMREKAEESVPENLQKTDWDFQTLHSAEKRKKGSETLVQVVVVQKSFSESFHQALDTNLLHIESILPMSFVFANAEGLANGVSVIIEQYEGTTTLCGVEEGFVIATHIEHGVVTLEKAKEFLHFLSTYKGKKAEKIILSHCPDLWRDFFEQLSLEGYAVEAKDFDVFTLAALQEKISGRDEDVLNIDMFSSPESRPLWKRLIGRL